MNWLSIIDRVTEHIWHDDRFTANLLALGVALAGVLLAWLVVRQCLCSVLRKISSSTARPWLQDACRQLLPRLENGLWWMAVVVTAVLVGGSGVYHLSGGDLQRDVTRWYAELTVPQILGFFQACVGVSGALWLARKCWKLIRWARPQLEMQVISRLGLSARAVTNFITPWFTLLEHYALAMLGLGTALASVWCLGLSRGVSLPLFFIARVATILVVARLTILATKALLQPLVGYGDRHLNRGRLIHYWERLARLVPFAERCFEMAVMLTAASLCVRELLFINFVAEYGSRTVQCIGIFFGTRVLIEFTQVLLNESFGLYGEEPRTSQQARTLVPLLQSCCQYLAHFGGIVWMIKIWGLPTEPVIAAAGVIGLALGLGAQSLVTDVVSGLFILFENQFLVGDYVEIGAARGTVVAVAIRHTQIRDDAGKMYLIPNGQIKEVVNYSKGTLHAVVDVKLPKGTDLDTVWEALRRAGHKLKQTCPAVLAEPVIHGVVAITAEDTTIRAVTAVKPGLHGSVENEFRRLLHLELHASPVLNHRSAA